MQAASITSFGLLQNLITLISDVNHHDRVCVSILFFPTDQSAVCKNHKAHKNSLKLAHLYCIHYWDISNCCNSVTTWSITCSCAGCWLFQTTDWNAEIELFSSYLTSLTFIYLGVSWPRSGSVTSKKTNKSDECDECGSVCLRWEIGQTVAIRGQIMGRFHNAHFLLHRELIQTRRGHGRISLARHGIQP